MNCGFRIADWGASPILRVGAILPNKANLARQAAGPGPQRANVRNKANSAAQPIVRNKADSPGGAVVQTNPISGGWAAMGRAAAPNKANCAEAKRTGKYLVEKELWRIEHAGGLGETKPIFTRGEGSVGRAPPYMWAQLRQTNPVRAWGAGAGGTKSAKQSQTQAGWSIWGMVRPEGQSCEWGMPLTEVHTIHCAFEIALRVRRESGDHRETVPSARPVGRAERTACPGGGTSGD